MRILTVNTGSTSIRLGLFDTGANGVSEIRKERHGYEEHSPDEALKQFLSGETRPVDAVSHRVVHGGDSMTHSCVIDASVERRIQQLAEIAPLHNPVAHTWIRACRIRLGAETPHVAVFDTAFFARLPENATHYALPPNLVERLHIRRYGFHGIAHESMWRRWCELRPDLQEGGRLLTLQLGGGCSAAAILHGQPVDTSMGFSPVEGLVMATRCGDLDPSVVTFLLRRDYLSPAEMDRMLHRESGLLGVSGISGNVSELMASEHPHARLALDLYLHRLRKYIGAYMVVLGGFDGIVIGGGVGEHVTVLRERIFDSLDWAGIKLDHKANGDIVGKEGAISAADSQVEIRVIPVDEERRLVDEAIRVLVGESPLS